MKTIKITTILLISIITSCRCYIDYQPITKNNFDNSIRVRANLNEGKDNLLIIDVWVDNTEIQQVNNIILNINNVNKNNCTNLSKVLMDSFYTTINNNVENHFSSKVVVNEFKELPIENRKTKYKNNIIKYTFVYNVEKDNNFENLSLDVFIILTNNKKEEYKLSQQFFLVGSKNCFFSIH